MSRWQFAPSYGGSLVNVWQVLVLLFLATACQSKEKEFVEQWAKGCSAGDLARCADLGETYLKGVGAPRDPNKAIEILRKACKEDGAHACAVLAQAYATGDGVAQDPTQASVLRGKACEDGDEEACVQACDNSKEAVRCLRVAVLSVKGAKDLKRAATYYRKACDLGHPLGCREVGGMYRDGVGVPKDADRAGELLNKADALLRTACAGAPRPDYCDL
jgi:TPR repeat protein